MLKNITGTAIAAAVLSIFSTTSAHAAQALPTRHIHQVVKLQQASLTGMLPATQQLKLSIAMPLRNQGEFAQLLRDLYNPRSPKFHQFLSVEQFTARYAPTQADYDAVAQFATANNLSVTARPANRMVMNVQGGVADINRAFAVNLGAYVDATSGRRFHSPDREPTMPANLKIWHVFGLDDFSTPQSLLRKQTATTARASIGAGSGPGGLFTGSDLRTAYYGGTALTGAGQSIGIVAGNYNISDIEAYYAAIGQSFNPAQLQNYSTDGVTNVCAPNCDDGEPVADIVSALGMAPGATVIEYFGTSIVDSFNAMATANVAKQLSSSYVYLPADPAEAEPIFQEMAAQGQSLFVASGDSGAYGGPTAAWYPSDDPYVTAVGGTDLTTGVNGAWASESAWAGSGGGSSTNNLAIPAYQQLNGVVTAANGASTTLRNVPDVASEASSDFLCSGGGCGGVGGTSLAAPRWAAFMALVNQQAANNGRPPIGFLNPALYAIGTASMYAGTFHDITTGNNGGHGGNSFNAVTGYDLVTGWGTPNGQALIDALAAPSTSTPHNVIAFFTDGVGASGSLDNDGYGYSSAQLGATLQWSGTSFPLGTPGTQNAYSGGVIAVPSGKYSALKLIGTGVNGNQAAQQFVVTYSDGTTHTFTQSVSDWFTAQNYPGESIAKTMSYRDTIYGGTASGSPNVYGYTLPLDNSKVVVSVTLPQNRNVVVLSVVPTP